MEPHFKLTDIEFERQFLHCQLPPSIFSHEAHLRLAWIHIEKYGMEQAEKNILQQLKKYVEFAGARDKFNITLTMAAIKAVTHFWSKSGHNTFKGFISEFPQLKYNFKELMECHYGFDIFNSTKAKNTYLAPDLLPFD
ncbi:MAG: hypothetical protein AB3N16_06840 [Flavobacteriaceae bacterium]